MIQLQCLTYVVTFIIYSSCHTKDTWEFLLLILLYFDMLYYKISSLFKESRGKMCMLGSFSYFSTQFLGPAILFTLDFTAGRTRVQVHDTPVSIWGQQDHQ